MTTFVTPIMCLFGMNLLEITLGARRIVVGDMYGLAARRKIDSPCNSVFAKEARS